MFAPSEREPQGWARFTRYVWWTIGVVFLYVAATVFLRWRENRGIDEEIKQKNAAERAAEDRRSIEALGGNRFEIIDFYSSPPAIQRGDTAKVCYGVSNAKSVRMEPEGGPTWPSAGRCLDVSPKKTTTYTLTAEDAQGHTITKTATVEVR